MSQESLQNHGVCVCARFYYFTSPYFSSETESFEITRLIHKFNQLEEYIAVNPIMYGHLKKIQCFIFAFLSTSESVAFIIQGYGKAKLVYCMRQASIDQFGKRHLHRSK